MRPGGLGVDWFPRRVGFPVVFHGDCYIFGKFGSRIAAPEDTGLRSIPLQLVNGSSGQIHNDALAAIAAAWQTLAQGRVLPLPRSR